MKPLLGGSPLFRKIMASILLASVFFLSLLNIVVYYSNEILEDALLAKQISIDNRLRPYISIETDRTLITVVLTNLIRNAVKHGQQSSIKIEMQGSVLSITDDGIGIDSEDLQHIFDFRFRGRNSQGYGVGLYISKLVCDYQGWPLDLVSNPQGGIIARVDFAS